MSPEVAGYLAKAWEDLDEARQIAAIGLAKAAARSAYYAAFHTAEALIFQRTGKIAKTHSGVRSEFARLAKEGGDLDRAHVALLGEAYKYKEIGDYGIGPDAVVELSDAQALVSKAQAMIAAVAEVLLRSQD